MTTIYPDRKSALSNSGTLYHGTPCKKCGNTIRRVYNHACRECAQQASREYMQRNKDRQKEYIKEWQRKNKHHLNAACSKYRAKVREQTPNNADQRAILAIYEECRRITEETGILHHVDHIHPISKGGLHHQDNLQILTATDNIRKGAKVL